MSPEEQCSRWRRQTPLRLVRRRNIFAVGSAPCGAAISSDEQGQAPAHRVSENQALFRVPQAYQKAVSLVSWCFHSGLCSGRCNVQSILVRQWKPQTMPCHSNLFEPKGSCLAPSMCSAWFQQQRFLLILLRRHIECGAQIRCPRSYGTGGGPVFPCRRRCYATNEGATSGDGEHQVERCGLAEV